ncbi:COX7C [Bugula neritina]|uniref:Cytochrome c oxidase subunit 7C, mitochondrial n=1 Tax=Bugula neritina TaxID=10212 RepID=A0A7J7J3S5_BUGNE|nr:COX7C [Bugula neritina]
MPMLTRTSLVALRKFSTSSARAGGWQQRSVPGSNLPFSIENRFALYLKGALFFGSGMAVPFIATRHQLLKR